MTREEAIICLQGLLDNPLINKGSYLAQAIEMAIQALSQEPCDDAISRQAVRHILNHEIKMPIKVWKKLFELVDDLPPITQNPETVTEFADRCRECGARYGKYRKEAKRWKNKWLKSQKSGHWIHFAQSDDCSECGWSTGKYISPSKYCPNCGAKMIEPQESEE